MCGIRALVTAGPTLALALALTPSTAGAQTRWQGPLTSEDGAPLHRISLTSVAEPADLVPTGGVHTEIWLGYSNIFEQDSTASHVLLMDMERLLSTTTVRMAVSDRLEVGGRLTFESTGGGVLDGFVSWWHGFLGVGNGNREWFPDGGYDQRLEVGSGNLVIDVPSSTLGLEDARLFGKWRLLGGPGDSRALSLRATLRLPARDAGVVRPGTDVGVTALARASGTRWHAHAMVGMATVRATTDLGGDLFRPYTYHFLLAGERALGDWVSAVAQYQLSTPVLRAFEHRKLDSPSGNLVFGVAGRMGDAWRWDLSFQEDLPAESPAVDFTLGLRLSRAW